jgi:solute carrier family 7 L-type amino acid transporter-like protein
MINIRFLTPMPALLCLGGLSLMMLTSSNVLALINYASFAEILICGTTVAALLILRITQPKLRRPIKVFLPDMTNKYIDVFVKLTHFTLCFQLNLFIPISFTAMSVFLLVLPFFEKPFEVLICLVIILGGFPFYFVFIAWRNKPKFIYSRWGNKLRLCDQLQHVPFSLAVSFTHWAQKLMFCVPETDHCD